MPALIRHGAATAWLVALVAAASPATVLAAPVVDPVPPDTGTQQQPAQDTPAPSAPADTAPDPCQQVPPGCPQADPPAHPPVAATPPDASLGPSGPVTEPAAQKQQEPAVAPAHVAPTEAVQQPVQQQEQPPVRHEDPAPVHKPQTPARENDAPDKPGSDKPKPKPGYDKPAKQQGGDDKQDKPTGGYGDKPGDHNGDHGDDEHDHVVFDRETVRLGGCREFSVARAKATFERIRYEKDRFKVTVHDLAVPEGTVLTVRIDGRVAGTLTIDENGDGKLTRRGDHLPKFLRLDGEERVTISRDDGTVLLSRACRQQGDDNGDD